jgi:tetratricopeptide (TPR) repeat protein
VAGQRFGLDLVRHLTGAPDYDCAGLVAHRLVDADGAGYRFQHALVQEGVYSSLTAQRRRELHRAAAACSGSDPVLRARHLDRAGDAGAPLAFLEAAEARVAASDLREAALLLERGLVLARNPREVRRIAMALGDVRLRAGDALAARDAYERALDTSAGDLDTCRALIGLAAAHRLLSVYEVALGFRRRARAR